MLKKMSFAFTCLFSSSIYAHTLLPDLKTATYPLHSRSIDTNTRPGRMLLRFSNGVANIGKGRLELRGGEVAGNTRSVYQRIFNTHGGYSTRLAGVFEHHPEHGHIHFNDFAHYKLRTVVGTSGMGRIVADSDKVSFCIIDGEVYDSSLANFSRFPRYNSCGSTSQGLSVGWADIYDRDLPDQWIDITDVPEGTYWLESTADPGNHISESNEYNNTARIKISIH